MLRCPALPSLAGTVLLLQELPPRRCGRRHGGRLGRQQLGGLAESEATGHGSDPFTAVEVWTMEKLDGSISGWWFGTFFIFHNIWDNPSHWLIFFKMVETCWNHQPDLFSSKIGVYTVSKIGLWWVDLTKGPDVQMHFCREGFAFIFGLKIWNEGLEVIVFVAGRPFKL